MSGAYGWGGVAGSGRGSLRGGGQEGRILIGRGSCGRGQRRVGVAFRPRPLKPPFVGSQLVASRRPTGVLQSCGVGGALERGGGVGE